MCCNLYKLIISWNLFLGQPMSTRLKLYPTRTWLISFLLVENRCFRFQRISQSKKKQSSQPARQLSRQKYKLWSDCYLLSCDFPVDFVFVIRMGNKTDPICITGLEIDPKILTVNLELLDENAVNLSNILVIFRLTIKIK